MEHIRYNKGIKMLKRKAKYMKELYVRLQQKFSEDGSVKIKWIYEEKDGVDVPYCLEVCIHVRKEIEIYFDMQKKEKGYFVAVSTGGKIGEMKENDQDIRLYKENILSYYKIIKECIKEALEHDHILRIPYVLGESLIKENFILRVLQKKGD